MPETQFGPLSSLVGRTFERDGLQRFIESVDGLGATWSRPPYVFPKRRCGIRTILNWLDNATEVKDGQG